MRSVKAKVIPVIIVATGTISQPFRKYLCNITGKHEFKEVYKTAILGIAHTAESADLKARNTQNGK
jgi:hypothetical protein